MATIIYGEYASYQGRKKKRKPKKRKPSTTKQQGRNEGGVIPWNELPEEVRVADERVCQQRTGEKD